MKTRTAYRILRFANAGHLRQTYGADFYVRFKQVAEDKLRELLPKLPDLGDSVASTSYAFITAYVPFFHAFRQFDQTREQAGELLWVMNENMLRRIPSTIRALLGRISTSKAMVRSLRAAQRRGEQGLTHPMDWCMKISEPAEGGYCTTWTRCGALQVLRSIGEDGVFPYACRIDYLMANLMGLRFTRTKTLADGDDCCNNYIAGPGVTEWAP
jgi:hypothetical protein